MGSRFPFLDLIDSLREPFWCAARQGLFYPPLNRAGEPVLHTYLVQPFLPFCKIHKVSGILIVNGELVLLKRTSQSADGQKKVWYEPPGGKPDYVGESPYQIVARELEEEVGAHVSVGECLTVIAHPGHAGRMIAYFECTPLREDISIENKATSEHLSVIKVTPQALDKLMSSSRVELPPQIAREFIETGSVRTLFEKCQSALWPGFSVRQSSLHLS